MSELTTIERQGVLIIHLRTDRIRTETDVQQIGEELANLSHASGGKVLLDLTHVQQMTSMMIGELIEISKECESHKITMKLCCLQPHIKEVFKTTGLSRLLKIYDTQEKAIAAFRKKRWFG